MNNTIKKTVTVVEAVELAKKHNAVDALLTLIPNNLGINLCAVKDITFEAEDDEYGQLVSLNINFIPSHDKEENASCKANGGPWPWLVKNSDGEINFA